MLRTNAPRRRRASLGRGRGPRQTAERQQERTRRFVAAETGEWHERQCAQDRAHKALRKFGALIRLRLLLRSSISKADTRRATAVLRREGFIVWRDADALILTGEPGLTLTFMDVVAQAGLLCPMLRGPMDKLLKTASQLRANERPDTARGVSQILPLLRHIESPS